MEKFVAADSLGEENEGPSSASVAPPHIVKPNSTARRGTSQCMQHSYSKTQRTPSQHSLAQISPPLTPRTSHDTLPERVEPEATFHNYLRAFYHFHPTSPVSSSVEEEASITVPLNQGDVILVHSIHPNGWADGTLLGSGARGWLPTNYCEAYDHESIRNLLNALTNLWDLVRSGENEDLGVFARQDYVRGMIAGVRFFLERSKCLTRESELIQTNAGLRRLRKGLLGDLSGLVKIAKRLRDMVQNGIQGAAIYEVLDELVLKAFKVVTRAVRFLDKWIQDVVSEYVPAPATGDRPPTPPLDSASGRRSVCETDTTLYTDASTSGNPVAPPTESATIQQTEVRSPVAQTPSYGQGTSLQAPPNHRSVLAQTKRPSVSHRVSYLGKAIGSRRQNLASEKLRAAHDSFLTYIGSFIGLHLQSRSSSELLLTTRKSVSACQQLLAILEEVWERDCRRSDDLQHARDTMHANLADLVQVTRRLFNPSEPQDDGIILPEEAKELVASATSCVRAAGDCVVKTRSIIEKIGDFEFEHIGLGLADIVLERISESASSDDGVAGSAGHLEEPEKPSPILQEPTSRPPPPASDLGFKPLPDTSQVSPIKRFSDLSDDIESENTVTESSSAIYPPAISGPTLGSCSQPSDHIIADTSQSPESLATRSFVKPARADSLNTSVTDSMNSYRNSSRIDEASIMSRVSTRATTPDRAPAATHADSAVAGSFGSVSELRSVASDDVKDAEEQILEKTYAHELIYNKEGQISGGSLPALVEQLTMHDSTPDPMFVTTFYLTFRLFTTPAEFAKCLVERFDYAGEGANAGMPVRSRVYNVFKGWLEGHWQRASDMPALGIIFRFATGKLRPVLPAAGNRLAELTVKVTEVHAGSLVPRSDPYLGKTGSSINTFAADNKPTPDPIITKSQLNVLRSARNGGAPCSILDFDPLELARQFTIIESRIFCAIQPEELLGSEWTKKADSKAVNVRAMSTLSTDLANLVADTILQLEEPKKRAVIIKQWIKIAMKCVELNNYDSLMAIICSLNSSMVLRLKRTWEAVSQKTKQRLEELKEIVDVGRNYTVLRARLQNHVAPCIPFVGIYLTDLTFVDVGNQTSRRLPGDAGVSVINFDKHMRTAKIIGQLQRFQVPYKLIAVPEMQEWMNAQIQRVRSSDQANVQSYYRRSLLLEPRDPRHMQKASPVESSASTFSSNSRDKERFDLWGTLHLGFSHGSKEKLNS